MPKKFLVPMIISIIAILAIIFAVVYKQTSKDPFENTEVVETLPPKETDEIITKTDKTETDSFDLDFEVEPPKMLVSGKDGNAVEVESGMNPEDIEDEVARSNYEFIMGGLTETSSETSDEEESTSSETETLNESEAEFATKEITPEEYGDAVKDIREFTDRQAEEWDRNVNKGE